MTREPFEKAYKVGGVTGVIMDLIIYVMKILPEKKYIMRTIKQNFSLPAGRARVGKGRLRHRVRGRAEPGRAAGGHQAHRQGQDQGLGTGKRERESNIDASLISRSEREQKTWERRDIHQEYTLSQ